MSLQARLQRGTATGWIGHPGTRIAVAVCVFLAALMYRSPGLFAHPRFWAEEGRYYYDALQNGAALGWVTLVVRGNYQLLLNLSTAAAAAVSPVWAAHVTTGFALVIACLLIALIALLSIQENWGWAVLIVVCVALAWLPAGYELYLTSTNVQWVCATSILVLTLLSAERWSASQRSWATCWVFCCALTGVPTASLAPFVIAAGLLWRSRTHLQWGMLLIAGALVQAVVVMTHPHLQRSFHLDPFLVSVPLVSQILLAPVMGIQSVEQLLALVRQDGTAVALFGVLALGLVPAALIVRELLRGATRPRWVLLTLVVALVTVALNLFGSIGDQDELVSAWSGGRYFYLATVAWLIILAQASQAAGPWTRIVAAAILVSCAVAGYREIESGRWKDFLVAGRSWASEVRACGEARPCKVQVWPGGEDWTFVLRRR